jgi:uncharacterized protein (TIGR01777 family)
MASRAVRILTESERKCMQILISGSSGLIGSALKVDLEANGHEIVALPRTFDDPIDFTGVDAFVHLAGESIATGRWTAEKKRKIKESRIKGTAQLAKQISLSEEKPSVFICASAIGYYGDREEEKLDESSDMGSGFLPEVCKEWEDASQPVEDAGIRTVRLRTGIVLSSEGGALQKMSTPFKMGGGGILGSGAQYMSWISLDDEVAIIRYLIDNSNIRGPVNLVSPNAVTNKEFTKTLGTVLKRPPILPMPAFAARLLFGEMADALLLSSARVYPQKLLQSGYEFKYPTLEPALRSILS